MSNIKIEIPATDPQAQRIFAEALLRYAEVNEERIRGFVEAQKPELDTDKYIGDVELPEGVTREHIHDGLSAAQLTDLLNGEQPQGLTPEQVEFIDDVKEDQTVTPPPPSVDVPPPPPSADVPPPPVTPPPPVAVADLPWDERIHASSKVKNQDGTWKARRKPPTVTQEQWDDEVKSVEDELRVLMRIRPNTPTDVQPVSFAELMVRIKPHLVNPDFVARAKEICDGMNLPNGIADLSRNETLIPQFIEEIGLDD